MTNTKKSLLDNSGIHHRPEIRLNNSLTSAASVEADLHRPRRAIEMSALSDAHRRSSNNNSHMEGDRSSSAGSSLGSCSPPPPTSHSPPAPRAPWLHEFAAATPPHVLQFFNLSAAGGGMLGSQPLAALHSMAERTQQHQQQQHHHQQQQNLQLAGMHQGQLAGHQQQQQGQSSPTGSGKQSPATSITSVGSNPHGIDTILSRPAAAHQAQTPVTTTTPHGLPPAPHPQHLTAPRYAMHAGFTASSGLSQLKKKNIIFNSIYYY